GVDEVDPGVERPVDDRDRLVVVRVAPGAEHHRPEAQGADPHPGRAERAVPQRPCSKARPAVGQGIEYSRPCPDDVMYAVRRSSPPKQMCVTNTSYCGTGCTATSSPAGDTTVIAPVISV